MHGGVCVGPARQIAEDSGKTITLDALFCLSDRVISPDGYQITEEVCELARRSEIPMEVSIGALQRWEPLVMSHLSELDAVAADDVEDAWTLLPEPLLTLTPDGKGGWTAETTSTAVRSTPRG